MAKTKPSQAEKRAQKDAKKATNGQPQASPEQLYASALDLVETSQPEEALEQAQKLWSIVQNRSAGEALPALNLLGEICVELGEVDTARQYFQQAARIDPNGTIEGPLGGGAEKFLWLAQLSEEGGKESVQWFEKGAETLQRNIIALESGQNLGLNEEQLLMMRVEKKRKLANALCGIVEVYMTDLSWEDDAEARCETLVMQAMAAEDETSPEILQTLASVRLSQERKEDAQSALKRSMENWVDLGPEDQDIPDFASRISLSRLLMEAELESEAMDVIERLTLEDDQSVEAWYLGGWCLNLQAEKMESRPPAASNGEQLSESDQQQRRENTLRDSRRWLNTALKLYEALDYEDERLKVHAEEIVASLDGVLGPLKEGEVDEWEDEWDGIEDDPDAQDGAEDAEMKDS
jgi:tetratricopeptide (TPR) repeat protein